MKRILFALCTCLLILSACTSDQAEEKPYIILISFDGFRYDYVSKYGAQNFNQFIKGGSSAQALVPSFPSKTFPNHYSIVTGMYPGNHGLVDNTFYDRQRDVTYSIGNRSVVEDPYFYGGLPLWQLVQQNGMKSASYFWVGSEAPVAGSFPDYYKIYDGSASNESRIETVFDWLELPYQDRPNFITLYFSLLDDAGHQYGPSSAKTGEVVMEADRLLGLLMDEVEKSPLDINVIITSDHGMYKMELTERTFIYAEDIFEGIDPETFHYQGNGTHGHVYLKESADKEAIYNLIKSREDRFEVYLREETPERWHYRDSDRIGDLFIRADAGHKLSSKALQASNPESRNIWGEHGFDPYTTPEMGAIFFANGPDIKPGITLKRFENVHIYPFIAQMLGIEVPEGIDGDPLVLQSLLQK